MQKASLFVLAFGALAAAVPYPTESNIEVILAPSKPPLGAIPIPVAEIFKNAKLAEQQTPAQDRMEEFDLGWKKLKKLLKFGKEEPGWEAPQQGWGGNPGLVGPFAFQLGAFYNPFIPIPVAAPLPPPPANPPCNPCAGYGAPASYGGPSYSGQAFGNPPPY